MKTKNPAAAAGSRDFIDRPPKTGSPPVIRYISPLKPAC